MNPRFRRVLFVFTALAALALAGCAGTAPAGSGAASGSSVTVYGTADGGVGKVSR